jgi:hypothetical protein
MKKPFALEAALRDDAVTPGEEWPDTSISIRLKVPEVA